MAGADGLRSVPSPRHVCMTRVTFTCRAAEHVLAYSCSRISHRDCSCKPRLTCCSASDGPTGPADRLDTSVCSITC